MRPRRVVLREAAQRDVDEAIAYYLSEGAFDAAFAFVEHLEQTLAQVAHHPEAGSPRYAHELDLPGLRFWLMTGYPYLVFYREHSDHVDVWRVLHGERDIPSWLR